ncbi:BREX-1 system phosphatase PglZ type A [Clostridium perfringens]|uniref:BREX-1 system phosphatase PglZ type A n=1 Tax=Clostridium perfringens TaxID=1502 RepID=UPI001898BD74|nr:BREX-1 system phosphatase PglZ type A [Clostridium perfringens]MDB2042773.1 BREX-1 system phosphatase PglZ type A [Clostridium perfringens]MDB2055262.1 BREX-1 system phosphatase PglZ type A [Clostridium perfringens]MDK0974209.1 BREX-1 system phosphatase PglZ type A [Clostridium perfringens]MDM0888669.1 BREX-1 system phosphatase PglZ type A [Clostridium perfringens]MDM0900460.1 BREX-1 system phosphatase PglZ type A [Clostridium perfringens]
MSELNNIVKALGEEFSKTLSRFEKRKIIIWYDYDRDFEDIIDEVKIDNVKVHKLKNDNYFYTKYLLEEEDLESNYLIYTNSIEDDKQNWILDIILYSESFYADKTSMIMRDLNIEDNLRHEFSKYKSFFYAEEMCDSFSKVVSSVSENKTLEIGILATISKVITLDFEEVVKAVLCNGLDNEENAIYLEMDKYNAVNLFWNYCRVYYGYNLEDRSLKKLFAFIVTTALSSYLKEENLSTLKSYIGNSKPNCIVLIDHWINHKVDYFSYIEYANQYENEFNLVDLIDKIDIDSYKEIDILSIFDKEVIKYIIFALEDGREDFNYFISLINIRRSKNFYEDYKNIYEALLSYLEMAKLKNELKQVIERRSAIDIIKKYSTKLYSFDFNYRKFYLNYDERPESGAMVKLKKLVDNIYVNWFLSELSTDWNYELTDEYLDNWRISGVLNQKDFYKNKVQSMLESGDKVFVIISDALRYEIGVELKERFNNIVIGSSNIEPMVTSIPSITKIGMASLLPNKEITINDSGRVFVDGFDSSGIEHRKQILVNNFENSIAVDFNSIPKNKVEFNELLKGHKLVYIYHNVIDAIGDKANTESDTFKAVEQALEDIMWLRDKITGWLGGVNIFVTADHGFLYQRSLLEASSKIEKENLDAIDRNRRSIITKEEKDIDGLFRFKLDYLSKENEGIYTYIPKSDIRFKTQGAGANYVHGGATLQEIIVPVVFYKHKRSTYKGYKEKKEVSLRLLNTINKITTEQFMLTFFQVEEVSDEFLGATYEIYMVDANDNVISNKEKIIADSKERAEERNYKVRMRLKKDTYSKRENYRLVVRNVDKDIMVEEIPFIIDIAIEDDFF